MTRRVVAITPDRYADLGAPCRSCVFWEIDAVRGHRLDAAARVREKDAWIAGILREWGSCGQVAMVDDEPAGVVMYAPAQHVPGAAAFPTAPIAADAVLLTSIWVDPRHAGGGLGRMLIQGMARDLVRRGVRAVEAFGSSGPPIPGLGQSCTPPAEFLARVGFKTVRPHLRSPRMRMELRGVVVWRDEVEEAWERLLGVVRPRRPALQPQHMGGQAERAGAHRHRPARNDC